MQLLFGRILLVPYKSLSMMDDDNDNDDAEDEDDWHMTKIDDGCNQS